MSKQHGGKRSGAGRPPKHEQPMKQYTIRLPEHWREELIAEFGSLQKAVETLVQNHRGA